MEFIFIFILLAIITAPFTIAGGAYLSRKLKRKKIEETLPPTAQLKKAVRINTQRKNDAFLKLKAFEYSGILYILDNKVCISGTKGQYHEFDLGSSIIKWEGIQAQNGAMDWFTIKNNATNELIYINGETGMFIFRLSKTLPSTSQIYNDLLNEQQQALTPPPMPKATANAEMVI